MDKYEYKLRSEEIKKLISQKKYVEAMEIADTIDWRRVKNVMMLTMVSDVYKVNRRYEASRDILLLAYDRHPGGRTIVYSLCELSIKLGEFVQAVEYYKEFVRVAPSDTGRYILKYKIYAAQEVSLEERIGVLEDFKAADYREKWGYELALLYHRAGMEKECIAECDELILTFGEGKYVLKAMELKMLHQPLTPTQQEKYDNRNGKKVTSVSQAEPQKVQASEDAAVLAKSEETVQAPSVAETASENVLGDTQVVGKELDIQVRTLDVSNKYNTMNIQAALADSMKEIMEKEAAEQEKAKQRAQEENLAKTVVAAPLRQDTGDMKEITFAAEEAEVAPVVVAQPVQKETPVQKESPKLTFDPNMDTASLIQNMTEKAAITAAGAEYDRMLSMENDGQISLVVPEETTVEKQITGQMSIEDILSEWEKMKKASEQRSVDDIKQRVLEQTGEMFAEFDKNAKSGLLAGLEDEHASLAHLPVQPKEPTPPPKSEAEILAEALVADDGLEGEDLPEVEELEEIVETSDTTQILIAEEAVAEATEEVAEVVEEAVKEAVEEAPVEETEEIEEVQEAQPEVGAETEEFSDAVVAQIHAKMKDEPKAQTTFDTTDMVEVSEKLIETTEKEVNGEEPEAPVSRALTADEKELFGALIQTDQMKHQIAEAIDAVSLAPYTGNVIITGEAGSGTMTLAKNLIKSVQLSDSNFSGKVAKISGAALDKKDIAATLSKLRNGALIIEKANGMSTDALQELTRYLEQDNEGIIVILEDTKIEMRKCLNKNPALSENFNARIDINAMDNDALVAYAKEYAYDQEYSIDDMGVLALYTRISDLQTGDHSVTLAEVRDIIDEGIWSANRKNLKHYFDILSGKRYDEEDMIVLREKDFVC